MEQLLPLLQSGSPDDLAERLGRMGDAELEAATIGLQSLVRAADAVLASAVSEVDRRGLPDRVYALSTKQWLRRFCRQAPGEAGVTVSVARRLAAMPSVAKRALEGEIPQRSLRQLTKAAGKHPHDFPLVEENLADAASRLDSRDLRRVIDHWRQQVDHAEVVGEAADRRSQRTASIAQTVDGMWHLDAWLDPESGHAVSSAMRVHADPGNLDPDDRRSHGQRMADALTEIARRSLDRPSVGSGDGSPGHSSSAGEKPHITVTVSYEQIADADGTAAPLPEIDGTPVISEDVRRLACDARIVRMVLDGDSQPLDVGRAVRTVPPAIRRALDARDHGCTWNGCDLPPAWCDAHHIDHWADGGPTSLTNLRLLCRRHHVAVHDGGDPTVGRRAPPDPPG